nr:uncharacterized protein CTRU02_15796 [Colletotrichum truncatum]XP_036576582.1 uncharacterized protein CTRU02_13575 [Colletotrichum truncatum]XP_036584319.1 uncharacterized protein CTRU02_05394 [Colletotrichum truncatum]XP_036584577.1 uncharacterized protein CTRU02_05652 [Colletotrichum truncatum]KAF6780644.1 hypothetical protein CTRU02_15796 [Colletotrichum truncatum]KAF6783339.1 hypothetical protein CTRU02_13575 [Colletotrichum truncatum]KAF6793837.1 hypothetical protein CTRU02_05394 [Col
MSQRPSQPTSQPAGYLPYGRQRLRDQQSTVGHLGQAENSPDARKHGSQYFASSLPAENTQFIDSDMQGLTLPSETLENAGLSAQYVGNSTEVQPRQFTNDITDRLLAVRGRLDRVIKTSKQVRLYIEQIQHLDATVTKITNCLNGLSWGPLPDGGNIENENRWLREHSEGWNSSRLLSSTCCV